MKKKKVPVKVKYMVQANWGGGLWDQVMEVKWEPDEWKPKTGYWVNHKLHICIKKEEANKSSDGRFTRLFDSRAEAQLFLDGAVFFKTFMANFFV